MKHQILNLAALATILASGQLAAQTVIGSVDPPSAEAGASNVTVTITLATPGSPAISPASVPVSSITIGGVAGSTPTHVSQYVVTANFDFPAGETPGMKDVSVTFPGPPTYTETGAFEIIGGGGPPTADFTASPTSGIAPLSVNFSDTSIGTYSTRAWTFGDGASGTASDPTHIYTTPGTYSVSLSVDGSEGQDSITQSDLITVVDASSLVGTYPVVDTAQTTCYDASGSIAPPASGAAFYGQDAQIAGKQPSYSTGGDGLTVTDNVTGLVWQQSPERTGDTSIDASDKITWAGIPAYVASLNAASFGGFNDWRLPSIKELYSLVDFRGTDPSGYSGTDTSGLVPYIDPVYFDFGFGDTASDERVIDAQYWSSNEYVSTTMGGDATVFGFNFADGRIKGYPRDTGPGGTANTMYLRLVRGNTSYGINQFADNGNLTVSDYATGLMWGKNDSGSGMDWQEALAWAQTKNTESHLGFDDWRLPDAKELQTLFDYTRSPATTGTAAIDPVFSCTAITAEDGSGDFPFYWTGTTHATWNGSGGWGVYHCFGTAFGYIGSSWIDVHGAGAQRSDPKSDDGTDYSTGHGPQGDCVRVDNFVRLVRTSLPGDDSVGDGITDAWRREHFGGTGTTTDSDSEAGADPDGDGDDNLTEFNADKDPNDPGSRFSTVGAGDDTLFSVSFDSSADRVYTLWRSADLSDGSWETVSGQIAIPGSGGMDLLSDPSPLPDRCFYRVSVALP